MGQQSRLPIHVEASWFWVFLIVLVGFTLRLPGMNESLWFDELWSTSLKLSDLKSLAITSLKDVHPPFYSILMFFWILLFGDSEIAVRVPPLIFGVLSIFLTYVLAARLTDQRTAYLAAILLCLSPVHIWYSQEARAYSALLFFLLVSITAYLKLKDPEIKPIWFF